MNDQSNPEVTRRRFLQGAAAAGIGSVAGGMAAEAAPAKGKLPTNPLGQTKLQVTKVSYGSLHTAGGRGGAVLKSVIEAGVNMVHNSSSYTRGNAIRAMGKVFADNPGMRDKLVLCVKGKRDDLEPELDEMLTALHTDHVDVYLPTLHNPDPARLDQLRKLQDALKKKGKIKFAGFVCHGALNDVLEMVLTKAPGYFDAALLTTQPILAAKYAGGGDIPKHINKKQLAKFKDEGPRYVENLGKLKKQGLGVISMKSNAREAMKAGADVFQAHCKTLLAAGADTVLYTFGAIQEVHTLKKLDLRTTAMTPRERRLADEFHQRWAAACLMCSRCTNSCPQGLPVNDLMRIRMYREQGYDCNHAVDTYHDLSGDLAALASRCGDCTACSNTCPVGLASAERVRYVTSLYT